MTNTGEIIFHQPDDIAQKVQNEKPDNSLVNVISQPVISMQNHISRVLLTISSHKPFHLFPDIIQIDEDKVTFVHKDLGSEQVRSVLISDISDVVVHSSSFGSQLQIVDSSNPRDPIHISVSFLKNEEAHLARNMIVGLIETKERGNNTATLTIDELMKDMQQYGQFSPQEIKNALSKSNPTPSHYYGDIIRVLFIILSILILLGLPMFNTILSIPFPITLTGIIYLIAIAGIINPLSLSTVLVTLGTSIVGFIFFEDLAFTYLFSNRSHILFGLANQLVAILFLYSLYFSLKTVRGCINNKIHMI